MTRLRLALSLWLVIIVGYLTTVSAQGRFWVLVNGALRFTGSILVTGAATLGGVTLSPASSSLCWTGRECVSSPANNQLNFTDTTGTTSGFGIDTTTDALAYFRVRAQNSDADLKGRSFTATAASASLTLAGSIGTYKNIATAGWGVPAIQAQARAAAVTNTGTASVATYANAAADGTFQVMCNVLVTTSTTHSFSCDTTYTDEGNTARTLVLPVEQLGGAFAASGLITNATGVGPYESAAMTIRVKASTTITIRTSSGGTFTNVVYNIDGTIIQIG